MSGAGLERAEVTCVPFAAEIETCADDFSRSIYFLPCGFFPFCHVRRPGLSVYDSTVDVVLKAQSESRDCSFRIGFPLCGCDESFERCYICVHVQVFHFQLHQLIVGVRILSAVSPRVFKRGFEFGPEDLVRVTIRARTSRPAYSPVMTTVLRRRYLTLVMDSRISQRSSITCKIVTHS